MLTPMQRQYYELKDQNPEAILLFRLGDFYEMFDEDSVIASKILGITLTARNKGKENEMKMCGIPYHAAENYINKLSKAGKKVAICEQVSDPSEPGIVKREVVQIITPGTILSENMLDEKTANYLVAITESKNGFGMSYCDISTGKFAATRIRDFHTLKNEVLKLNPSELLLEKKSSLLTDFSYHIGNISLWFLPKNPKNTLEEFFKVPNLKVFYLENEEETVAAAAMLLDYVIDTQKGRLGQITKIQKLQTDKNMALDFSTIKNLEIFRTMQEGKEEGSLLSVIDKTVTAGGGRKLKEYLVSPLNDIKKIRERLDEVEKFTVDHEKRESLRTLLSETRDAERILAKISSGKANPKDLIALKETLERIPQIEKIVIRDS